MLNSYELDLYFLKYNLLFEQLSNDQIKYNSLLLKYFEQSHNKLDNQAIYISFSNLIREKQNIIAWNGIFQRYHINANINDVIDLYNEGYYQGYINNIYRIWELLYKNDTHKNKVVFAIILSFSFSYYHYLLYEDETNIIFIPFIQQALMGINQEDFLLFLNRLIRINNHQSNLYEIIENIFLDNFKRKTSDTSSKDIFQSFLDHKGVVYVQDVVQQTNITNSYINKFFNKLLSAKNPIIRKIREKSSKNSIKYRIEYIDLVNFYQEDIKIL